MRNLEHIYHGALLTLLALEGSNAAALGALRAEEHDSMPRHSQLGDQGEPQYKPNHRPMCLLLPRWAYESREINTFCRWFHGVGSKPVMPEPAAFTRAITVPKTAFVTVGNTTTVTETAINTVNVVNTVTVTPDPVVQTETETLTTGVCPQSQPDPAPVAPFMLRSRQTKRALETSPSNPESSTSIPDLAPLAGVLAEEATQIQAQLEQHENDMVGYPTIVKDLGIAVGELHHLCTCVLKKEPYHRAKPPKKKTVTAKVTSVKTLTIVTPVTAVDHVTKDLTITAVQQIALPASTKTQTVTVSTCTACFPDGHPCDLDTFVNCCSQACQFLTPGDLSTGVCFS